MTGTEFSTVTLAEAELIDESAAGRAKTAGGVRFIDDHVGAIPFAQFGDLAQRGDIAVHAEERFGDDEQLTTGGGLASRRPQTVFEIAEVIVAVNEAFRFREPQAVDDRGMVGLVGDGVIIRADDGAEQAKIRDVAAGEHERRLGAVPGGEGRFHFVPQRVMAAQQARGGAAARQLTAAGEQTLAITEIVIGGEIDAARRRQSAITPLGSKLVNQRSPALVQCHVGQSPLNG